MRILSDIAKWKNAVAENASLRALLAQAKVILDDRGAIITEMCEEVGRLRSLLGNAQAINDELAAANRGLLEVNEYLRPDAQRWRDRQLREALRGQRRTAARASA